MFKEKNMWFAACIIISIAITLWIYIKQDSNLKEQVKDYIAAEATIIQVFPARMSRFGMKQARYGISFKAIDGKTYVQYNCELSSPLNINDKVTIYYNPENPDEPIVDKKE